MGVKAFREEIEHAINKCSMENGSNTPDFILAKFLGMCLAAFDMAVIDREEWYGIDCSPGKGCVPRSEP